jgi:creatinine deaminase
MAYGMFGGSFTAEEKSIVTSRRNSHTPSFSIDRRASRTGSISHSHVHALFMNDALAEARASLAEGGIPIGCLLVRQGQIVARGRNRRIQRGSPILHAELDCLQAGGRQPASFYRECTLYVTHAPCSMCAGAIRFYGISRVVIGEDKIFHGDEALLRASGISIDVLDSNECHEILENYIKENPTVWNENIAHEGH